MNDALGADVHPGPSSHLPVHSHTQSIKVVEGLCVLEVGDDLPVGDHSSWALRSQLREQAHGMPGIHVQTLVLIHLL
jgi:hypothetical protein